MTYTPYQFANNASSTVAGGAGGLGTPLSSGDTTLYLPTGHGARFPASGYFMLLIGPVLTGENVKVTLRSTDTLTIVRAQEGTSAATWPVGTTVQQIVSAQSLNDGMSELATLDSAKANLSGAAFTGAISTTSTLSADGGLVATDGGGGVSLTAANKGMEIGSTAAGNTPFIDFHSSGSASNDYDVRLLASAGTNGVNGDGLLTVFATNIQLNGALTTQQSVSVPSIASSGTITTAKTGVSRVTTGGAVTGVIMQAGALGGQQCVVVNESGNTITMAAAATSNVADGVSCVIGATRAMWFVWDTGTSRWYHS